MRRLSALLLAATVVAACGRLGVGEPGCETTVRNPSTAIILAAQAVPSAKYAPCVRGMSLAWDDLDFQAGSGEAGFAIYRDFNPVLEARLTAACDVAGAREVPSGLPDVDRFENISSVAPEVTVRIIPLDVRPLVRAGTLAAAHHNSEIEDRPLIVEVDTDLDLAARDRVNRALLDVDFVWIIGEMDTDENTLELRSRSAGGALRGIDVGDALDRMEEQIPDVTYRGHWFFTFPGGCITYEFDARGPVAETIAQDAESSLGFYPLYDLRRMARRLGYDVGGAESD